MFATGASGTFSSAPSLISDDQAAICPRLVAEGVELGPASRLCALS